MMSPTCCYLSQIPSKPVSHPRRGDASCKLLQKQENSMVMLFKILSSEINFCYARIHTYDLCSYSLDWVFCAQNVHYAIGWKQPLSLKARQWDFKFIFPYPLNAFTTIQCTKPGSKWIINCTIKTAHASC